MLRILKYLCCLGFAFCVFPTAFAQQSKIDSLQNNLQHAQTDSSRIDLLNKLCWARKASDTYQALAYGREALKISTQTKNQKAIARSLNNIGFVFYMQSNFSEALKNYYASLEIREKINDQSGVAACYGNIALVFNEQKKFDKTLEYYFKALKINSKLDNKKAISIDLGNIGLCYSGQDSLSRALEYMHEALQIAEKLNDKEIMARNLNNIALIYKEQNKLDETISYLKRTLVLNKDLGDEYSTAITCNNIGAAYSRQAGKTGNKALCTSALAYLDTALELSQKVNDKKRIAENYLLRAQTYSVLGDFKKAYGLYTRYTTLRNGVMNEDVDKQILEMGSKYESEKKDKEIQLLNKNKKLQEIDIEKEKLETAKEKNERNAFIAGLVLVLLFSGFIYKAYKQKQKDNQIIAAQNKLVEEKNKDITDSINYARRIQEALLPPKELKRQLFPKGFVFFQPCNVVSGDFYWFAEKNEKRLLIAADCTGHGVPGAFMSMLGNAFLNEVVNEKGITTPADILSELRHRVIHSLRQTGEDLGTKDGMDISLLCFSGDKTVEWAGANNPLWIIRDKKLIEYEPDKRPIGYYKGQGLPFTNHSITLQEGDSLYIFTDGYADQFGGEKGKKFKSRQLKDLLLSIQNKNMTEQESLLLQTFNDWKGELEQVDDVLLIGIRV